MSKPILCLDFDGVIHSYTSGWKGADQIPDPPVEGSIEFIIEASKKFKVCIFSSRSNQQGGRSAMQTWLWNAAETRGLLDKWFSELDWPLDKPPAMITIDDRAITFTGVWPNVDSLLEFKPWNKK